SDVCSSDLGAAGLESDPFCRLTVGRRRAQSLLRKHGRPTQQKMVVWMAAHRTPKIGALKGVDVLRSANVDPTLRVRCGRIEKRRGHCVFSHRLSIREHVRWVERTPATGNHNLDRNDVDLNGRRSVAGRL